MAEDRETQGGATESTERIPPGSMPPEDHSGSGPTDDAVAGGAETTDSSGDTGVEERGHEPPDDDEGLDEESKQSFPASDPPAW